MVSNALVLLSGGLASALYGLCCFSGSPMSFWGLSVAGLALSMPLFFRGDKVGKYFVPALVYVFVQVGGSAMVLVGSSLALDAFSAMDHGSADFVLVSGFLMKMGVFPFHFWPVRVFGLSSWLMIFIGLSFLKYYLYVCLPVTSGVGVKYLKISILGTFVAGGLGAANQLRFKPLVAWISVMDGGWAILAKMAGLNLLGLSFFLPSLLCW